MPGGQVFAVGGEQLEGSVEPGQDPLRGKYVDAGRGQLQSQRQAVQPYTELGHGLGVRGRERKRWIDRAGAVQKQSHGWHVGQRFEVGQSAEIRQLQRRHGNDPFPTQAQPGPTGHQDFQMRTRGQQLR